MSAAFFTCWTRKEDFIKAKEDGWSLPLRPFQVSLAPGEPPALIDTQWDPQEASRSSLQVVLPGPDYVGALAVEGGGWQPPYWHWSVSADHIGIFKCGK